jgi:ATP-binding cassette subfamily F protein 3
VLLDALVDFGGTLIFVSHDRYFVERLATKIVEVGEGSAIVYPGTYAEFLWRKEHPDEARAPSAARPATTAAAASRQADRKAAPRQHTLEVASPAPAGQNRDEKKRLDAETRRRSRAEEARRAKIGELELRIGIVEREIREIEETMAAAGFYSDRGAAQPVIDRHQSLMWEVGDLMHRWEELQSAHDLARASEQ